jgi:CBS domain-containing protein
MLKAKDVMNTRFHTLPPKTSIAEAVMLLKKAGEVEKRRVFGMMVTDETHRLIGMISMYDILLFIRPKHIHVWGTMEDLDVYGLTENICESAKSIRVEDIMTTDIITVSPDTHIMMILDIMIKKHVRRVPVINGEKIEGIVYISDLFYYFADKLSG